MAPIWIGSSPSQSTLNLPSPSSGSSLRALVEAYLRGESGAVEILNDFLQDSGWPTVRAFDELSDRLGEVLFHLFSPSDRLAIEADFLERAVMAPGISGVSLGIGTTSVQAVRQFLSNQLAPDAIDPPANQALSAWMPEEEYLDNERRPSRDDGIAWAAWALARRLPLVASRTLRLTSGDALQWQVSHVLSRL